MAIQCSKIVFFFIYAIFTILCLTTLIDTQAKMKPTRLLTKLIHRDSMHSLYYNLNSSSTEYNSDLMVESSIYRFAEIQARIEGINDDTYKVNLKPMRFGYLFLVNFSIGNPPVPQLSIMDTGSGFLMVRIYCPSCHDSLVLLNPLLSESFTQLPCVFSPFEKCIDFPLSECRIGKCFFTIRYGSGTVFTGYAATERLMFENGSIMPQAYIGCIVDQKGPDFEDSYINGVFGLGLSPISISYGLRGFSYCIGDILNRSYEHNYLVLGDGAYMEGFSTPLILGYRHYYLHLTGISVQNRRLNIDPNLFRRKESGNSGVIIDSGTEVTWLAVDAYNVIVKEVQENFRDSSFKQTDEKTWLCYWGTLSDVEPDYFLYVTFHFEGEADWIIEMDSLFYQRTRSEFCMTIRPSNSVNPDYQGITIIGMLFQQYHNFGFDLVKGKLYIKRIDCQFLEE